MRSLTLFFALVLVTACNPSNANDAGAEIAAPPADSSGGSCSLVGTWRGTIPGGAYAGQAISWTFVNGGAWNGVWGAATVSGTWTATDTTATLIDGASVPAFVACPATQQGAYSLQFNASCAAVTWRATMDVCDGRRLALDTLSLTRQ
jgi:hypothetical protein